MFKGSSQINPNALKNDYSGFERAAQIKQQTMAGLGQAISQGYKAHKQKLADKAEAARAKELYKVYIKQSGADVDEETLNGIFRNSGAKASEINKAGETIRGIDQYITAAAEKKRELDSLVALQNAQATKAKADAAPKELPPEEFEPSKAMTNPETGEVQYGQVSKKTGQIRWLGSGQAPNRQTVTSLTESTVPSGYKAIRDPKTGEMVGQELIPGSPQETEILEAERIEKLEGATKLNQAKIYAGIVHEDIGRSIDLIKSSPSLTTGLVGGQILKNLGSTEARNLQALLGGIRANLTFERLMNIKKGGATLGQVSAPELKMLEEAMGSLDQATSPDQLIYNLERLEEIYNTALHGTKTSPWDNQGKSISVDY